MRLGRRRKHGGEGDLPRAAGSGISAKNGSNTSYTYRAPSSADAYGTAAPRYSASHGAESTTQ